MTDEFFDDDFAYQEHPNAKMFDEIFTNPQEKEKYFIDFNVFIDTLDAWIEQEEKIDPYIANYMGMVLLGLAHRLGLDEHE